MRTKLVLLVVLSLIAGTGMAMAPEKKSAPSVEGAWGMDVQGPAAHGPMTATLQLKQEVKKVSGTFAMNGRNQPLSGTFADGTLSMETTDTPSDQALSFNALLKEDGTLAGHVSTPMGDMKWTASRVKEGK